MNKYYSLKTAILSIISPLILSACNIVYDTPENAPAANAETTTTAATAAFHRPQ